MKNWINNQWVQHIGFWLVAFVILLRIFAEHQLFNKTDIVYTILFLFSLVGTVYINLRILIPHFLTRSRWPIYVPLILVLLLATALFNEWIFNAASDYIFPGFYFISYYTYLEITQFVLVFILLTSLLKLSKSWFELQETQNKLSELKSVTARNELETLKAQINPHFLFNSLHSIYSLSIENQSQTSDIILKLADVLRFMLYETNAVYIPLEKELKCIENYLDLQKIRLASDADIRYELKGKPDDLQIAPLLLMPLVENSFKHGTRREGQGTFVHFEMNLTHKNLELTLANSSSSEKKSGQDHGLGLFNLKRRLELLYPEKYMLEINRDMDRYNVFLKMDLV